jgi:translation initiation factor IF-1
MKEDCIECKGIVEDDLPGLEFKVKITTSEESTSTIVAYLSGKMRKHKIKLVPGDRVLVELSPYDLTKGRITFREK